MNTDFYQTILALKNAGSSFVTATVVSRRAPVSSHLGDRAIVFSSGKMQGFVGGSCSREIVRKQALEALQTGKPRLVLIRPDATLETIQHVAGAESIVVPMTCASEGAVDVYLEPHQPARLLLVAGFTPVAEAICRMAALLEYNVVRVVTQEEKRDLETQAVALPELTSFLHNLPESERQKAAAVVATQGHYDEPVLEGLLLAGIGFVSLLASRKRAVTVRELLELQGVPLEQVAQIKNPAGLDINAKTPPEVAVSILAEIIASTDSSREMFTNSSRYKPENSLLPKNETKNDAPQTVGAGLVPALPHNENAISNPPDGNLFLETLDTGRPQGSPLQIPVNQHSENIRYENPNEYAISPVDGERIHIPTAVHFADHNGRRYYFTCPNCKRRFLKNPEHYLSVTT
jgi:xanthine dehydrogenase accessory factor